MQEDDKRFSGAGDDQSGHGYLAALDPSGHLFNEDLGRVSR
jgi:hypothetical protein